MYKLNLIWSACRLGLPLLVSKHCNLVALDNKVLQLKLLEFKGLAKGCEEFCSFSTTFVNTSPREHTCGGRSMQNCIIGKHIQQRRNVTSLKSIIQLLYYADVFFLFHCIVYLPSFLKLIKGMYNSRVPFDLFISLFFMKLSILLSSCCSFAKCGIMNLYANVL